jgi:catechol 2,3-dioxygenase-like lactoylglutathione lyase family enzyme
VEEINDYEELPMIEGLSHITYIVRDLERMAHFLMTVFEAKEIYSSDDKTFSISQEKFFLINDIWVVIMEGEPLSEKTYNHVAFKVAQEDFDKYIERVRRLGIEVREGRSRVPGEGNSLYFYDYDNHLYELHTGTLQQRLERYEQA